MPTLLSDLINAIPVAGRGDVISPESHNSLRDAIVAIVTELGGAVASRNVTLTFAPTFLEVSDPLTGGQLPKWTINTGLAQSFGSRAFGWLPLQLPHGSRIQQLHVVFGGTGHLTVMNVKLERQYSNDLVNLANLSVRDEDLGTLMERNAPFTNDPLVFPSPGTTPADIVDSAKYKYFVRAELPTFTNGALPDVTIFAIRVDCSLG
jgi:hypothetical protein